ncbi:MAG: hypothetical protein Q9221_001266 [Calogaya cf. arnoldii]
MVQYTRTAVDSEKSGPTAADGEKQDMTGNPPRNPDDAEEAKQEFRPSPKSRSPASIQHSRSVNDHNNGSGNGQRNAQQAAPEAVADEKAFEVQWDGEKDPANPRSMSSLRKWMIVIIVSLSSACVYVSSSRLFGLSGSRGVDTDDN